MSTTNLKLVYLVESQSQKVVTINTALDKIDALMSKANRVLNLFLMHGKTPLLTGGDAEELTVPYGAGGETLVFNFKRCTFRQSTTGSSASQIMVEKSTAAGAFSATSVLAANLQVNTAAYEASTTSFASGPITVSSGDKLRVNVVAIGTGSGGYEVSLVLQLVPEP